MTMHDSIATALEPPVPGRLLRALSPVFGGIRLTQSQIFEFAEFWRERAIQALDGDGPVIVALGDSLSQGIGSSSPERTWLHRFSLHHAGQLRAQPAGVVNLSRSGARISDVVETQLPALRAISNRPMLVTCTVGNNDLAHGSRLSTAERSFSSLLARLPEVSIIATLPAKGSLLAKRLNRTVRSEAELAGLRIADVDEHLPTWRGRAAGDRFHPNDLGYEAWFSAFAEALDGGRTARPSADREPHEIRSP